MIKPSMFNHVCSYKDGFLLFNSIYGLNNMVYIKKNKSYLTENLTDQGFRTELRKYDDIDELYKWGYFIDETKDEKALREVYYSKERMNNKLHLVINVTEKCNFRCKYCGLTFKSDKTMTRDVQDSIIQFVKDNISNYQSVLLDWFGGEPTLAMDVIDYISKPIINICKKEHKPIMGTITTNGYLLDSSTMNRLIKDRIYKYIVTLDGIEKVHNEFRVLADNTATYKKIVNNLIDIKDNVKRRAVQILIRTNIGKDMTNKDNIDTYYEFINKTFGSDRRFGLFIRPINDLKGERMGSIRNKILKDKKYVNNVIEYISHKEGNIRCIGNENDLSCGGCFCPATRYNKFNILVDGTINKCDDNMYSPLSIGKIEDGKLIIDEGVHAKWLINTANDVKEKCDDCRFSMICNMDGCPKYRIMKGKTHCPLSIKEINSVMKQYASKNSCCEI